MECLEGSEREDEIVAQQMQAALEAGQLNRVSDMLGIAPADIVEGDDTIVYSTDDADNGGKEDDDDSNKNSPREYNDWDDLYYDDWFSEDSV